MSRRGYPGCTNFAETQWRQSWRMPCTCNLGSQTREAQVSGRVVYHIYALCAELHLPPLSRAAPPPPPPPHPIHPLVRCSSRHWASVMCWDLISWTRRHAPRCSAHWSYCWHWARWTAGRGTSPTPQASHLGINAATPVASLENLWFYYLNSLCSHQRRAHAWYNPGF